MNSVQQTPLCSAAILAGGQSRRMGQNKALLPLHGQPLIAHIAAQLRPAFAELLVSANDADLYQFLGLPVVADATPGSGPLMGILSCLQAARHEWLFVTGCDVPDINLAFIAAMQQLSADCDVVMPLDANGRPEPLFALYRKSVIPVAQALLAAGGRRIIDILPALRVAHPPLPGGWLKNLNTPDDYASAVDTTVGNSALPEEKQS